MALTTYQHMIRRTGISASEIAALAGMSRYATPISIYEGKVLPLKTEAEDDDASIPMELGNALEEPIARLYRRKTLTTTRPCATMRHPEKPYAICTPDRGAFRGLPIDGEVTDQGPEPLLSLRQLQTADTLVQCKSTSWRMKAEWGEPGTDQIPHDYVIQEIWEMGITGHQRADVAVLFDKDRFAIYHVGFSAEVFEGLYELAERFMIDHVTAGVPPSPDASDRYAEFLRRAFPLNKNDRLDAAPAELHSTIIRFAALKNAEKTLKTAVKLYGNAIRLTIGDRLGISGPFGKVTWKKNRDSKKPDFQKIANEAQVIARTLLQNYGGVMVPEEREAAEKALREIESRHVITTPGARVLRTSWTDGFKADIAGETTLDLIAIMDDLANLPQLPDGDEDVGDDE